VSDQVQATLYARGRFVTPGAKPETVHKFTLLFKDSASSGALRASRISFTDREITPGPFNLPDPVSEAVRRSHHYKNVYGISKGW